MGRRKAQVKHWEGLKVVHPIAAGLDIGSEEIWAAVVPPTHQAVPPQVWNLQARPDGAGRLAGGEWGRDRGDGIDRRVLDTGL